MEVIKVTKKLDNQGVTLIELLLVLAIAGIVMSSVMSFLITNIRTFDMMENDIELQQQGQFAMDFMTERIIEAIEIEGIWIAPNHSVINNSSKYDIEMIVFKTLDFKTGSGSTKDRYVFRLKDNNLKIGTISKTSETTYNTAKSKATIEVANYINEIEVQPIPSDALYKDARGIRLTIKLKKDKHQQTISNQFFFRNSKRQFN